MAPFFQKLLRAGETIKTAIQRVWEGIGRPFLSKGEAARRASDKFEARTRREKEDERLDRLRNPRDYQGR